MSNETTTMESRVESSPRPNGGLRALIKAVALGGVVSGVLDALDGVVAYYAILGLNPIQVLQYIASGALGKRAFEGGLVSAGLGTVFHFLIAFVAAAVYAIAAKNFRVLRSQWIVAGLIYGVWVWVFMNFGVLPFSSVDGPALTLPLILNGVIGHAVFVGLPIAYFSRRLGS
jgi:hypothetical protein